MPAPTPAPTRPATLAVPVLLSPPRASLWSRVLLLTVVVLGPDTGAAVSRIDRASQGRADKDHRAAAAVAVAADGPGCGRGCSRKWWPHLRTRLSNRTPFGNSDLDDVGPGGGGVIAADGLVVAEAAAGDISGEVNSASMAPP